MNILYFDCFSGISGDMTIGALLGLGVDFKKLTAELRQLNLTKEYELSCEKVTKNHIHATKFNVTVKHHPHERSYKEIKTFITSSSLNNDVKNLSLSIFECIADAEAKIHGISKDDVHFHEIGAIDSIIDIVGTAICIHELHPTRIIASPIPLTRGTIETEHGAWPLPAPATLEILKGVPTYAHASEKEIVTPTGAAIIRVLAHEFTSMPHMTIENIAYGAGSFTTKLPNVLRVIKAQTQDDKHTSSVDVIETNIDDMNPQFYELLIEQLFKNDALDVFLENIIMKKGRPAIKLTVITNPVHCENLIQIIFNHSTTLGIRIRHEKRYCLEREIKEVMTKYGKVRMKIAKDKSTIHRAVPEYEDMKKIAQEHNLSLDQLYSELSDKT